MDKPSCEMANTINICCAVTPDELCDEDHMDDGYLSNAKEFLRPGLLLDGSAGLPGGSGGGWHGVGGGCKEARLAINELRRGAYADSRAGMAGMLWRLRRGV
jgi:hypothetical protein